MKIRILAIFFICFPMLAAALHCDFCKSEDELYNKIALCDAVPEAKRFNFNLYERCVSLLKQCPKPEYVIDETCINGECEERILYDYPECRQLQSIAQKLSTSPNMLTIKRVGNLAILTQSNGADGEEQYFIFTPNGCLIDTAIDPRKVNANVAKQYQSADFFMENWDKPHYRINPDGTQSIRVLLKITDSCRGCSTIGWAVIDFNFTNQSMLDNIQLVSFKEHWED